MSDRPEQPTIPAGKLSAYERWELPVVDARKAVGRERLRTEEDLRVTPLTAEQVEEIREAARREGFEQGHREGLAAGHSEGLAAAEAELQGQAARLQSLIERLLRPAENEQLALEAAMIELVMQVSESVIGRELLVDSSVIGELVRESIVALPSGASRIAIRVHPDDLATLQKSGFVEEQDWRIEADESVAPGGCSITSGESLIDYTVSERFRAQVESLVRDRYALVARLHGNAQSDGENAP